MARRTVAEAKTPPNLIIPRADANTKLSLQLEKGRELLNKRDTISNEETYMKAEADKDKWRGFVSEMLLRFFDNDSIQHDFLTAYGPMTMAMHLGDQIENFENDLNAKITALESIIERLELIPEILPSPTSTFTETRVVEGNLKDVFIVHGHDLIIKEEVARFVSASGLSPIILHEQANGGKTLIEKLEQFSAVGFAVVIMTPDDMGFSKKDPNNIQPRARQNVITELGFFVGKLGRKNVAVLFTEGVELPSDFLGIVYIPLKDRDSWKIGLAREIKNAGLSIDLNKAFL